MNRVHKTVLDREFRTIYIVSKCRCRWFFLALISSPLWQSIFSGSSYHSLLMSLSVTLPSPILPLYLAVYVVPRGAAVLFFYSSSGHEAKESPSELSVYKALCHVNKDKQSLSLTALIQNSNNTVHFFLLEGNSTISTISVLCRLICLSECMICVLL